MIVPIPKGLKCMSEQDNYRGITLLPVLAKLFEKWVMLRVEKWAIHNKMIHKLQGAAQKRCSSINTAWLVRENINHNLQKYENVFVVSLDTRKAFDTVWQNGLFYNLFNAGINGKTWRIIRKLFNHFKCSVQVAGKLSDSFEAEQGIHQGAPMSMFLYEIAVNNLLKELNCSIYGANILECKIACPAFADDITLMSVSLEGMQQLVSMAYMYSKKWRFSFNPDKCKLLVFGKTIKNVKLKLGNYCIKQVSCDRHLGTILSCNAKDQDKYINEVILQCKTVCFAMQSLGSHRVPVTPVSSNKLYWQVCIPKLCYGLEGIDISDKCMDSLEQFHIDMSKHQQGLPKQCSNVGSLGTMGWKKLETYIDFMRLMFLWRLLLLPMECIYKEVVIKRFILICYSSKPHTGPTANIVDTCKKYGLLESVITAVENANYMSLNSWKQLVKNMLNKLDLQRYRITCKLYKSLSMVNVNMEYHSILPWWLHCFYDPCFSRQNRTIARLLLNVKRNGNSLCALCMCQRNSACHVLFLCPKLDELRSSLWNVAREKCPKPFVTSLQNMPPEERCAFILNGFNINYVNEWKDVYDCMSNFIHKIYIQYEYLCSVE